MSADLRATYPLAHRDGLLMFVRLIAADGLWHKATPVQRRVLTEACAHIVERIPTAKDGDQLGDWPRVNVTPRTLASMQAKGLVDDDCRVTVEALDATYLMLRVREDA